MRILIIEDDANKMRHIEAEVLKSLNNAVITQARSYQSGLSNLVKQKFDCLLLDMSLPVFDITHEEEGFQVDPFSGRNILAEMARKKIAVPTVVITMFETFGEGSDLKTLEELDKELALAYPDIYKGAIYYNSSEINWKKSLNKLLEGIHDKDTYSG